MGYKNAEQNRAYARRYYAKNKERVKAINRKSNAKHSEQRKAQKRKHHADNRTTLLLKMRDRQLRAIGVTPEGYQAMLAAQGGHCALCERTPGKKRLNVDHDHKTGKIRMLLCTRCNLWVGLLEEHVDWWIGASAYLAKFAI